MDGTATNTQAESDFPDAVQAEPELDPATAGQADEAPGSGNSVPLIFHFTWQDMDFNGEVSRAADDGGAILTITGTVGILPFSAENISVRKNFIARYRAKGFRLGRSLRLTAQSAFELTLKTQLEPHASPADVIKAVTVSLLGAKSDLEEVNGTL